MGVSAAGEHVCDLYLDIEVMDYFGPRAQLEYFQVSEGTVKVLREAVENKTATRRVKSYRCM